MEGHITDDFIKNNLHLDFRQMLAQCFCFWGHLFIMFFTFEKNKKKEKNVTFGAVILSSNHVNTCQFLLTS